METIILLRLFFFTCHEHNKDSKKFEMHESVRIQFKNQKKNIRRLYLTKEFNEKKNERKKIDRW